MAGCSVTVLKADDELLKLWDAPVNTSGLALGGLTHGGRHRHSRSLTALARPVSRARSPSSADYLTELDSAIGDADHGANMARGMTAVMEKLGAERSRRRRRAVQVGRHDPRDLGRRRQRSPLRHVLPADGHDRRRRSTAFDGAGARRGLRAGLDGVVARGKAEAGDKTMFDAMAPALDAFDAARREGSIPEAAAAAFAAAEDGRDATEPLVARKGRASYLGERSAGHLDPGATSTALLFQALADALARADAVIGIVVVSHSPRLAEAAVELALRDGARRRSRAIAIAAGAGEGVTGTDATGSPQPSPRSRPRTACSC